MQAGNEMLRKEFKSDMELLKQDLRKDILESQRTILNRTYALAAFIAALISLFEYVL